MAMPGRYTTKMLITPDSLIGTCSDFVQEISSVRPGCCCFLDPDPDAWNSGTTYQKDNVVYHEPPAWVAFAYDRYRGVSHDGKLWYTMDFTYADDEPGNGDLDSPWSEIQGTWYSIYDGDSLNQEPGVAVNYWRPYTHCDSTEWDSMPPFGGIAKTPMNYALSLKVNGLDITKTYDESPPGSCRQTSHIEIEYYMDAYFLLERNETFGQSCVWSGGDPGTETPVYYDLLNYYLGVPGSSGSCSGVSIINQVPNIALNEAKIYGTATELFSFDVDDVDCPDWFNFGPSRFYASGVIDDIAACDLKGTVTQTICDITETAISPSTCIGETTRRKLITVTASWRPVDCDYERWDDTKSYSINDCTAWGGKFYKSCANSNIGHEPEDDATNVCEVGYYWRTV